MAVYTDASRYEILYDLKKGEYAEKAVGGIRTRTIRAGDTLEVESYPLIHVDQTAVREKKRRQSTAAQIALNLKNARKRMRRLLEANFGAGDLVLHPTFDYGVVDYGMENIADLRRAWADQGFPMYDSDARRIIRNFIARVRRRIKKRGGDPMQLKYLYVIETTCEPKGEDPIELPARYHYHMIMSGLGILTIDDINELWGYGYTKAQGVDMRFNGLAGFTNYITKQRRGRAGGKTRRWAHSKNLREPEMRVSDRKISRRRAAQVARDVQAFGKEIFEKLYPGYELQEAEVNYSDFVAGAFIYARLRRRR